MTRQIVIKLNEKKFKPILQKLKSNGYGTVDSYSELVGKIIFFDYLLWTKKCKEFGDKTQMQFLMDKLGETHSDFKKFFLSQYREFITEGKMKDLSKSTTCFGKK
jgi:hypothetical protein